MRKLLLIIFIIFLFPGLVLAAPKAKRIKTDTSNFDGSLSASETTVQSALDALDDAVAGGFSSSTITGKTGVTPVTGDFVIGTDASDSDALKKFNVSALLGGVGTDDQTIDVFTLATNTLSISLEDDGEASKTVDLSGYLDDTDTTLNLAGVETITGNWVNTTNPWAANEITEADPTVDTSSEIVAIIGAGVYQGELAEGAFVDGDKTKLDGIEASADVTDTANVTSSGALMDSEVDADIKTMTIAASSTISGSNTGDDATDYISEAEMDSFSEWITQVSVTGTPDGSLFLRDDGSFQAIPGGGDALVANPLSQFASTTSAQFAGVISNETGTGVVVLATSPALVTPALGTPSALVLTNATGLPVTGLANNTDGELITWSAAGVAETVAVGTATHVLTSNGVGAAPTFQAASGGGSPGGSDTQVQFNDSSSFGGDAGLTYNKTTDVLTAGSVTTTAATAPSIVFKDSDATAGDDNAYFVANATDTGDGTEDIDLALWQQIAGTATEVVNFDADGTIDYARDVTVPDEVYGASWNDSLEVPSKNAVYDKIEALGGGGADIGVRVTKSGTQSITTATGTTLTYDGESYDTDTMHDNATNNTRLTATTAGKYLIWANTAWSCDSTTGIQKTWIDLNGTTEISRATSSTSGGANCDPNNTLVVEYDLSATDYIEADVWHNKGAGVTVGSNSTFGMRKIDAGG